jgi:hypothetical protein
MPKPKPTSIVRHEIVLGRAEREIARDLQLSYTANRLISPFTNISPGGSILLGATGLFLLDYILDNIGLEPNWKEIIADMTPDQIKDWFESQNLVLGGIGAILGGLFTRSPAGARAGFLAGLGLAELAEDPSDPLYMGDEDTVLGLIDPDLSKSKEIWLGLLQFRAVLGITLATPNDGGNNVA